MRIGRWPVLLAVHGIMLVIAPCLVSWLAQPIVPSSLDLGLSWPYTMAVTVVSGAVVGLVEGALLRSPRRPFAGYIAMLCFSAAALWLPLVMVTFPDGVVPNDTADVATAMISWGSYWFAMTTTALLATVKRDGRPTPTDAHQANGNVDA